MSTMPINEPTSRDLPAEKTAEIAYLESGGIDRMP